MLELLIRVQMLYHFFNYEYIVVVVISSLVSC